MAAPGLRADYSPGDMIRLVPDHLLAGLTRYIERGVEPGGALWAIVCNGPAFDVVTRADERVLPRLPDIYRFLYHYAPGPCWGTQHLCEEWVRAGGLEGHDAARGGRA